MAISVFALSIIPGTEETDRQLFEALFRELVLDVHGIDLASGPPPDLGLVGDTEL